MTKRKTTSAKSKRKGGKKRPAPAPEAIEPSFFSGAVTARRMGRPARLTRQLVAQFIEHLKLGLPLRHAAALCGILQSQLCDWLHDGRRDADGGRRTIAGHFSEEVRRTLAEFQQGLLGGLVVYQRMAEGWEPSCEKCRKKGAPCGAHPKNPRLAADLAWKMLTHRFPGDWNASMVRHEIASGDDDGGPAVTTPGEEGARPAMVAGLVVFMPRRNEGI